MNLHQVESLFGGPAGDYSTRLADGTKAFVSKLTEELVGENCKVWIGDNSIVVVYFDEHQRVDFATYRTSPLESKQSFVDVVSRWLRF